MSLMHERMRKVIKRQDAERGRPLTDKERLQNLSRALDSMTDEEYLGWQAARVNDSGEPFWFKPNFLPRKKADLL
jgi:hypothetical protein